MRKFSNCNIIEILEDIMRHTTEHYQTDFNYDKQTFFEAAYSSYQFDKNLIWLCRRNGTHCFSEREAYVQDTSAHNTSIFYGSMTREPLAAYAVEVNGFDGGYPLGNLYELDYNDYYKSVKEKSLPAHHVLLVYKDGISTIPYEPRYGGKITHENLQRCIALPADLKKWDDTVKEIQEKRLQNTYYSEWDFTNLQNSFTVPQKKSGMEMGG